MQRPGQGYSRATAVIAETWKQPECPPAGERVSTQVRLSVERDSAAEGRHQGLSELTVQHANSHTHTHTHTPSEILGEFCPRLEHLPWGSCS